MSPKDRSVYRYTSFRVTDAFQNRLMQARETGEQLRQGFPEVAQGDKAQRAEIAMLERRLTSAK
jgi:hypothetical protein